MSSSPVDPEASQIGQHAGQLPPRWCAICLDPISTNNAVLVPCLHEYDLECFRKLLKKNGSKCPLCRSEIIEFRHSFTPEGGYNLHNFAEHGRFIEADEEVRPGMTDAERHRALEIRRLRERPHYTRDWRDWRDIICGMGHVVQENTVLFTKRLLNFQMDQDGTRTTSALQRIYFLEWYSKDSALVADLGLNDLEETQDAMEVYRTQCLATKALPIDDLEKLGDNFPIAIMRPTVRLPQDERALSVGVCNIIQALSRRSEGHDNRALLTITISQATILTEEFATASEDGNSSGSENIELPLREKQRMVRLVREEMQGAFELNEFLDSEHMDIEVATTGIVGQVAQLECDYCPKKHRNGDCNLPAVDR